MNTKHSFGLSITPSFFAAGCCATTPLMVIFGFTFAEQGLQEYIWHFRALGILLLTVSICWYFRKQGIRTTNDIMLHKNHIVITIIQTCIYTILLYIFFITVVTPFLWQQVGIEITKCCSL